MAASEAKKDKRFPVFVLDSPLRKLFESPTRYCTYVKPDQVVADLGCGPGFYTLALAQSVGPTGRVYAVDSNAKAIQTLVKKAAKQGFHNIEAHTSSAAYLDFIEDASVDFILADGLLCSMAPQGHEPAVSEMQRILKPEGKAVLVVGRGRISYVGDAEWETILEQFDVQRRNHGSTGDRWALVSKKQTV
jgi:ubiquinone/menaquinone biosynthesis C-methylase UbiE